MVSNLLFLQNSSAQGLVHQATAEVYRLGQSGAVTPSVTLPWSQTASPM